jgi:hypothetical protein
MRNFKLIDPTFFNHDEVNQRNISSFIHVANTISHYKSTDIIYFLPVEGMSQPFNFLKENPEIRNDLHHFEKILVDNDINLYVVYGSIDNPRLDTDISNFKILQWPTFLLQSTKHNLETAYKKPIREIRKSTEFDKLFMCFNNRPRAHRCAVVDNLFKLDLFKDGLISWNIMTSEDYSMYDFKYWKEELLIVDKPYVIENQDTSYLTDTYLNNKCLINVINETYCDGGIPFVTEKTFKSLLIGQPFIAFGNSNQNKILKEFGFKLYDDVFDYSFDDDGDFYVRVDKFTENINRVKNEDLNELYDRFKEKVEYNRNRCHEIIERDLYIPEIFVDLYKKHPKQFDDYSREPYIKEIMKNI